MNVVRALINLRPTPMNTKGCVPRAVVLVHPHLVDLRQRVLQVVLLKSTPTQLCRLILFYY